MKRQSKGTVFDISIRGDELENNRIQLEHNLQNTELSFRLSSTSDDDHDDGFKPQGRSRHQHQHRNNNNSSVEYPRHISEPSLADDYPPLWANRSRDRMDDEDQHNMRAWSYRTGDDEDGISPYGGETVSTAAHHASAITINTGLGGGRAARRDPSMSGAEYDPERPLHAMIAGVNSKHSMFDMDPSKHHATATMTYDPLVVDSTAELDRILASGHAPPPPVTSRSFQPTPPTSSVSSDSENGHTSTRPKLADHLRHVSFSPKRPRTAQSIHASPAMRPTGALEDSTTNNNASMNMPTPRPARRAPSYAASPAQPEVRLQPATPSTAGSKFTRMARGINKEIEATQAQEQMNAKAAQAAAAAASSARPASAPPERNPFYDIGTRAGPAGARRTLARDLTSGKIYLPDVTGLTSAVESPAKPGAQYYLYRGDNRPRDSEARLLQTLSSVQGQLRDLQEENSISRRRVRELEMELEECKRQVARERTRLFEREEFNAMQYADPSYRGGSGSKGNSKGKGKATESMLELDDERLHTRYKEAVDEKKALEALINSLRSHLTRLTSELASHQELLNELRRLRDSDAQALRDKGAEIIQLKEEVQRLAGEVEVLRGVVEEGLKERRASREISVQSFDADTAMSQDLDDEELEHSEEEEEERSEQEEEEDEEDEEGDETEEPGPFDPSLLQQSSPAHRADRTMRTDHATLGSSNLGASVNASPGNGHGIPGPRFVDEEELDHIAQEMEERRSNRSSGSVVEQRIRSVSPARRGEERRYQRQRATVEDEQEEDVQRGGYSSQAQQQQRANSKQQQQQEEQMTSRPAAPTPSHAKKQYGGRRHSGEGVPEPETPFPQIRGEHLERLFFSAPEHNAKTCTVCYRRRHRANSVGSNGPASPSWSHPQRAGQPHGQARDEEEDEGYEGSEGAEGDRPQAATSAAAGKGKQREYIAFSEDIRHWQKAGQAHGVPPQTVVARVIRELEDDFTHYKSIYVELADQYKVMDAASDVKRRNLLAKHLREVVDVLEQKGDQIASLYDLLEFKDKPVSESVVPNKVGDAYPITSWGRSTRRTTTAT